MNFYLSSIIDFNYSMVKFYKNVQMKYTRNNRIFVPVFSSGPAKAIDLRFINDETT